MRRFRSLSARLVLTAVLLVAAVAVLAATATTIAVRDQLLNQLDQKVVSSIQRVHPRQAPDQDQDGDVPPAAIIGNQGPGTLVAYLFATRSGGVLGDQPDNAVALSDAALSEL